MARTRSPNYPVMSLAEALEAIRPVFKAENRNRMSRLVLAKHLGYSSLNGRALGKIGAVRAYGLIEGSGDDLRVSADAISAISAPTNSDERRGALERCALNPTLFSELRKEFPEAHPSAANLKFKLIQRRLTEEAAAKATLNYLETMNFVAGNGGRYVVAKPEIESPHLHSPTTGLDSHSTIRSKQSIEKAEFPLPEGVVRVEFPADLSAESYDEIEAWFNLVLRRVKRSVTLRN